MRIYFLDELPIALRRDVHGHWIDRYDESPNALSADIILCGVRAIDAEEFPNCKYFIAPCTNTDHIIGISGEQRIISIKGHTELLENTYSTAEHTMLLMGMLARKQFTHMQAWARYDYVGTLLRGKTLGIIGFGRVGKQLKDIAYHGYGMKVLTYDTNKPSDTKYDVLTGSDFISININIHPNGTYPVNKEDIALIRDGAFLINTSRGRAVDEKALLFHADRLGGIALDVMQGEPSPIHLREFRRQHNCILTPHIGGCTLEDLTRTSKFCYELLEGLKRLGYDHTFKSKTYC